MHRVMEGQVLISQSEYDLFQKLLNIISHADPEKFSGKYFICGEGGEKDQMGLPDRIHVCPAFGLNETQVYVKQGETMRTGQ